MRIAIIIPEEALYLPALLQRIAEERAQDIAAVVLLSAKPRQWSWKKNVQRYLRLFGAWDLFRLALRVFGAKVMAKLRPSGGGGRFWSVTAVARHYRIPVWPADDVNAPELRERLRALDLDALVSIDSPQIFGAELLAVPRRACLNVHCSLLPKYRGVMPSFWVLANGESETGVTVHLMDESVDNGDIVVQHTVPITPSETQHSLLLKTKALTAEAVLEALRQVETDRVQRRKNDAALATRYPFPTAEAVKRFRAAGRRFF